MTQPIRVTCLLDRYWDPTTLEYQGTACAGTLIDTSVQSAENDPGKFEPVGVVQLDDGGFACVPMPYIRNETAG